ncbi:unnamed protein product, partial [Tilletia laevis]
MNPSEQDYTEDKRGVKRQRNLGSGKNAINKRPQRHTAQPQRFVPAEVQRVYPGEVAKHGKDIYKFHNEEYRNGFCEKAVSVTSLVVEDVQPTLQEIELFQGVTAEVNVSESVNLRQLAQLKRKANEVVVQPGFRILDEEGNTHLVPPRSLLLLKNAFSICIDHEGHEIRKGDTMKETEGDSPRNGKVIQPYQSGVVFLFSRDISENNGVWYASPSRLTPLTPHHIGTSVKDSLDKMNPARN